LEKTQSLPSRIENIGQLAQASLDQVLSQFWGLSIGMLRVDARDPSEPSVYELVGMGTAWPYVMGRTGAPPQRKNEEFPGEEAIGARRGKAKAQRPQEVFALSG
jgi:hypothetical protein